MQEQDSHYQRMCQLGFHDGAFLAKSLDDIDFNAIKEQFRPRKKGFLLPRIVFLGLFRRTSMTDQRHICKALGFEYYPEVKFAVADEGAVNTLTSKWRDITQEYTKLIVIGDASTDDIAELLYKRYIDPKKPKNLPRPQRLKDIPIFIDYKIPVLFESELLKMPLAYSSIKKYIPWKKTSP